MDKSDIYHHGPVDIPFLVVTYACLDTFNYVSKTEAELSRGTRVILLGHDHDDSTAGVQADEIGRAHV